MEWQRAGGSVTAPEGAGAAKVLHLFGKAEKWTTLRHALTLVRNAHVPWPVTTIVVPAEVPTYGADRREH